MFTQFALASLLCLVSFATTAQGAGLPMPTVEYSADRIMETEAGTFEGKVYSAKDKERSETSLRGMTSVMILRRDKQLGWMLMPAQKMYQQMDLAKAQAQSGGQPQEQVEITEVGSDTVEGQSATKYKLIMKDGSAGGFMWFTKDGIMVKMDTVVKNGRDKSRMTLTLRNVKIGSQDASLFELPSGYNAMPSFGGMSGLSGLGGASRGGVFGR
ncbi:MAG: DUF4412 domain-containing protein [Gammaproteobacteria bacterium]